MAPCGRSGDFLEDSSYDDQIRMDVSRRDFVTWTGFFVQTIDLRRLNASTVSSKRRKGTRECCGRPSVLSDFGYFCAVRTA